MKTYYKHATYEDLDVMWKSVLGGGGQQYLRLTVKRCGVGWKRTVTEGELSSAGGGESVPEGREGAKG